MASSRPGSVQPGTEQGDIDTDIATLQELTARLARLSSTAAVAGFVLDEGIARLGATNGSLCLVVGDHLEISAWLGYAPEVITAWRHVPIDHDTPSGECAARRQAIYCESVEELLERWPVFRHRPITGDPSFAVLPLEGSDGIVLGTMVIGYATPRRFEPAGRRFLEALAAEASVALERARVNEALVAARAAAESASTQLAFLAEASSRLARSLDLDETLATVGELAVPRVADRCVLYLSEDSGQISKHPLTALSPDEQAVLAWTELRADASNPIGQVIASGRSVYTDQVSDEAIERAAGSPEYLALLRRVGMGGSFLAPLQARGKGFGVLAYVNRRGRPLSIEERALGEELAARAAVAIDNARLFTHEARIAETLQHALLPEALPVTPGVSLAAAYRPGTAGVDVGGDWYDVVPLGTDRLLLVVGDVSGRGLVAARLMASLRHGIRAYAFEGHGPAAILDRLTRLLDIGRDDHFATVLCALLDVPGRTLTLASAGHLLPVLLGGREPDQLGAPVGTPVGVPGGRYGETTHRLAPAATLLAFTDGLVERRGEHLDEGVARLWAAASARVERPLSELIAGLLEDLAGGGQEDDTALLAVRLAT